MAMYIETLIVMPILRTPNDSIKSFGFFMLFSNGNARLIVSNENIVVPKYKGNFDHDENVGIVLEFGRSCRM